MHKHFRHPSREVLEKAKGNTKNFPKDLAIPKKTPLCRGCAEGKMSSKSFPSSQTHASKRFEKIHSDLKSFPVESYHRYKYFISFIDDFSSYAWVVFLRNKSDAATAIRDFLAMVQNQYGESVKEWMTDEGGEYKSLELDRLFKEKGIKVL
jgi:transposase InsO family protein